MLKIMCLPKLSDRLDFFLTITFLEGVTMTLTFILNTTNLSLMLF